MDPVPKSIYNKINVLLYELIDTVVVIKYTCVCVCVYTHTHKSSQNINTVFVPGTEISMHKNKKK